MKKTNRTIRAGGSSVHADLSFIGDEIDDELEKAIKKRLRPLMKRMSDTAQAAAPIGGGTTESSKRDPRLPVGHSANRKNIVTKNHGKAWTSRKPGRLKASIRGQVHIRKDKTAVVGFLEAGNHPETVNTYNDAYYAQWQEFGFVPRRGRRGSKAWNAETQIRNLIRRQLRKGKTPTKQRTGGKGTFKPFLRPTFKQLENQAVDAIDAAVVEVLRDSWE